jgi:hypothetical protein
MRLSDLAKCPQMAELRKLQHAKMSASEDVVDMINSISMSALQAAELIRMVDELVMKSVDLAKLDTRLCVEMECRNEFRK